MIPIDFKITKFSLYLFVYFFVPSASLFKRKNGHHYHNQ